jgi:phage gp46-like protein
MAVRSEVAWAVGLQGTMLRTSSADQIGALAWDLPRDYFLEQNLVDFRAVAFADERRGWVVGSNGTVLYTVRIHRGANGTVLYMVRYIQGFHLLEHDEMTHVRLDTTR